MSNSRHDGYLPQVPAAPAKTPLGMPLKGRWVQPPIEPFKAGFETTLRLQMGPEGVEGLQSAADAVAAEARPRVRCWRTFIVVVDASEMRSM